MNQFRSSKFRKWLISLFLIVGIFPSIQAAFACEKIDDRIQFKTNCLQMDAGVTPCAEVKGCNSDILNSSLSEMDSCCDSVSHTVALIRSISQDTSVDDLLILGDLDPPPSIISIPFALKVAKTPLNKHLFTYKLTVFSALDTYLHTQRFRI